VCAFVRMLARVCACTGGRVRVCACACVCVYVRSNTYIHACIIYVCTCTQKRTHMRTRAHALSHMYICLYNCRHMCINVCIYCVYILRRCDTVSFIEPLQKRPIISRKRDLQF